MNVFPFQVPRFDWRTLDGKTLRISVAVDGDYYVVMGRGQDGVLYILAEGKREE